MNREGNEKDKFQLGTKLSSHLDKSGTKHKWLGGMCVSAEIKYEEIINLCPNFQYG